MQLFHPARALAVISGNPEASRPCLEASPLEHAKHRVGRVDLCVMLSLCLPVLQQTRSRLTRDKRVHRHIGLTEGSVHTVLRANLVCWPTLFLPFSCIRRVAWSSRPSQDCLADEATPRVAFLSAGARRRKNGILLCADACLAITGPSHDNGSGECDDHQDGRSMPRDHQCRCSRSQVASLS